VFTKSGWVEVTPKPSTDELAAFYADEYYQEEHSQYSHTYSDEEILFFQAAARLCVQTLTSYGHGCESVLDVGCGEGFFPAFLKSCGSKVVVTDFSSDGLQRFNAELFEDFIAGDAYSVLPTLREKEFDLINVSNVLEHVIDPREFLRLVTMNMHAKTVIRCVVPNDYSSFQELLIEEGLTENTWFCPPEHLTYFNVDNIDGIFEECGLRVISKQVGFPIEMFLANRTSNYALDRSKGKDAHRARVMLVNHFVRRNIKAYQEYCEHAAKIDFGRDLTVYAVIA
jgi:SAM-dependent methyltransferase